jgi:uncharacterized lipoprotein YddW (UPF0748 family)
MKKNILALIILSFIITTFSNKGYAAVTQENMQAVWISTVYNADLLTTKNNPEAQKKEYIEKLDQLKAMGINTVVVQVRPKADALYKSDINPWSEVLTGTQGLYPGYDPMAFMIEQAHNRGMEFHAWLNPYRITTSGTDLNLLSSNHPARLHPDWVITYNNAMYYNPELEEVKQHIADTVKEIVDNYNVDAIHFDDYFYPSNYPLPEGQTKDGEVANARRYHVNEMIYRVSQVIKNSNKNIKFGISPVGIWKNADNDSTGSNTSGNQAYYSVYGDSRVWIKNEWIDYVVPQIYWETGNQSADYETLVKWWNNEVNGTKVKLYIGQAIYKDVVAQQIDTQLAINKNYSNVSGSFYFSLRDLINNRLSCSNKIAAININQVIPVEQVNIPAVEQQQPVVQEKSGNVTADILNLRNGAGITNSIIGKLKYGTQVTILQTEGKWYNVKLQNGNTGWVSSDYVKMQF